MSAIVAVALIAAIDTDRSGLSRLLASRALIGLAAFPTALLERRLRDRSATAALARRSALRVGLLAWPCLLVASVQTVYLGLSLHTTGDALASPFAERVAEVWRVALEAWPQATLAYAPVALVFALVSYARLRGGNLGSAWGLSSVALIVLLLVLLAVVLRGSALQHGPLLVAMLDGALLIFTLAPAASLADRIGRRWETVPVTPSAPRGLGRLPTRASAVFGLAVSIAAFAWLLHVTGASAFVAQRLGASARWPVTIALAVLLQLTSIRLALLRPGGLTLTPLDLADEPAADRDAIERLDAALRARGFSAAGQWRIDVERSRASGLVRLLVHGPQAAVIVQPFVAPPHGRVGVTLLTSCGEGRGVVTTDVGLDGVHWARLTRDLVVESRAGADLEALFTIHERDLAAVAALGWPAPAAIDAAGYVARETRSWDERRRFLRRRPVLLLLPLLLTPPRGGRHRGPLPA